MIDLSESFDTKSLTADDLRKLEMDTKTSGRNKSIFGWPFTSERNSKSPYSLLTSENNDFAGRKFATASDTNLIHNSSKKTEMSIPDFKYPKFIPLYNKNRNSRAKKINLNASHPIPWFDIEASCVKMEENNTIADLSRYLSEGKLYAVNDISKKELKKLESKSHTNVNLDEAYTNEDVMAMYRIMHTIKKERQMLMKPIDEKLKSSNSSTSLNSSESSFDVDSPWSKRETKVNETSSLGSGTTNSSSTECSSTHLLDMLEGMRLGNKFPDVITGDLDTSLSFSQLSDGKPLRMSKPSPRRFGDANERHCEAVSKLVKKRLFSETGNTKDDSPVVDLFVELLDGRIRPLCHIKTGMANLCLNSFFFPCTNVASVTWVSNIREILLKVLIKKNPLKDIFEKAISSLSLNDAKAVLLLSTTAKDLIKHRHICMIDTLCVTLGIKPGSLLLLGLEHKPADLI